MEKLTIKDVRSQLSFNINYGMADISLNRNLMDNFDFEVFLPSKNMNLQRELVWTPFQKEQLIYSVLKGIKLPPIYVLKYFKTEEDYSKRDHIYQVIDGKQRLTTLLSFINSEFYITWKGGSYYFKDLHPYLQSDFYNCITSNIGYDYPDKRISDDEKIKWFEMINFAGTPQDLQHLQNVKNGKNTL